MRLVDEILHGKVAGLVIPGVNCVEVATGGIGTIGIFENYVCSALRGDASMEALTQSVLLGGLEGFSAGTLHWLGKKIAEKMVKNGVGNLAGKNT